MEGENLTFRQNMWVYWHLFTHFSSHRCICCQLGSELAWPLYLFAVALFFEVGAYLAR